jgi:ATP-dependent DNA ligase
VKGERIELRPPVAPMVARPAPQLPDEDHGRALTFEPKLDGWRCIAFHDVGGRVDLRSRRDKPLTPYFPEIVGAVLEQLPAGTVIDGELVVYRNSRCDFSALQERVRSRPSVATPATLVVFDVLALAGQDLRRLPYRKRRKRLRRLLADATPPLALMPATGELLD